MIYGWGAREMEGGVLGVVMGCEIDRGGSSGGSGRGMSRTLVGISGDVRKRVIS